MTKALEVELNRSGMGLLGLCRISPADALPALPGGGPAHVLALAGNAGSRMWPHFTASPEYAGGAPDPLNRWSARILANIAERHGAGLLLPFDGPPWWPFQQWAMRAGNVSKSPLGVLAHARWGLWFAFRGAFLLPAPAEPAVPPAGGPCETCVEKPCLDACPASALTRGHGYEPETCRAHVAGEGRGTCATIGCLVRHACPFGRDFAYSPEQATFHMAAFIR